MEFNEIQWNSTEFNRIQKMLCFLSFADAYRMNNCRFPRHNRDKQNRVRAFRWQNETMIIPIVDYLANVRFFKPMHLLKRRSHLSLYHLPA